MEFPQSTDQPRMGRRNVATGEAQSGRAGRSATRGQGTARKPAPAGAAGASVNSEFLCPCAFSTGSATVDCVASPLHPWLHSAAPAGAGAIAFPHAILNGHFANTEFAGMKTAVKGEFSTGYRDSPCGPDSVRKVESRARPTEGPSYGGVLFPVESLRVCRRGLKAGGFLTVAFGQFQVKGLSTSGVDAVMPRLAAVAHQKVGKDGEQKPIGRGEYQQNS